jgi:phosphoribosyl 1,2-cyclic phosphodiesterase
MQVCVAGCDAYFIEADYSEELLWKHEDYTVLLKERIASPFGHLSNTQTMEFLNSLNLDELKWVTVGHLSENTNSPELVNSLFREYFPSYLDKLHIAPQKNYLTL